jgi:YQGE family putative transporter
VKKSYIRSLIAKERKAFERFGEDARRLILVNLAYGLAYPFITLFAGAFVFGRSSDPVLVIYYQYGWFLGLILGYFLNGLLLRRYDIRPLFFGGMVLSIVSLLGLIFLAEVTAGNVLPLGGAVGLGSGLYWSNRNLLSVLTTNDENRNFFTGIEQLIIVVGNSVCPLLLGVFFWLGERYGWYDSQRVYEAASLVVLAIVLVAGRVIMGGNFKSPVMRRFVYWKFSGFWHKQRMLTFLIGALESGFMIIPLLLILTLVGGEASFGFIEAAGALLSATAIYFIGKISRPGRRTLIMLAGAVCSVMAGLTVGLFYSVTGILLLKVFQAPADPLTHSSFRATLFTSVERAAAVERRHPYAYTLDNEYWLNGGRIAGGGVFLLLDFAGSGEMALRYTLLILALLQFGSVYLVRYLSRDRTGGN